MTIELISEIFCRCACAGGFGAVGYRVSREGARVGVRERGWAVGARERESERESE